MVFPSILSQEGNAEVGYLGFVWCVCVGLCMCVCVLGLLSTISGNWYDTCNELRCTLMVSWDQDGKHFEPKDHHSTIRTSTRHSRHTMAEMRLRSRTKMSSHKLTSFFAHIPHLADFLFYSLILISCL